MNQVLIYDMLISGTILSKVNSMVIRFLAEKRIPLALLPLTLLIVLMSGCVSKDNIIIPPSQPIPHPKLTQMQSLALKEIDQVTYFGRSKKYQKNGIQVVVLSGAPYEIGYSQGVLLQDEMNVDNLVELNRGSEICWMKYPEVTNLHAVIFRADTLDFWIAAGPPPATRGRWVGFNLNRELYGRGNDPEPLVIPPQTE